MHMHNRIQQGVQVSKYYDIHENQLDPIIPTSIKIPNFHFLTRNVQKYILLLTGNFLNLIKVVAIFEILNKLHDENKKIEPDRKCVVWSGFDSAIWGCRLRNVEILVGCDGCLILNRQFEYALRREWRVESKRVRQIGLQRLAHSKCTWRLRFAVKFSIYLFIFFIEISEVVFYF